MISPRDLIAKFNQAYQENYGYIWGTTHEMWTEAKQADYAQRYAKDADRQTSVQYGSKWIGHYVTDCSGLFVWSYKQFGETIAHGSNSIWSKYLSNCGELNRGKRTDGNTLRPGSAVFTSSGDRHNHIGLYIGDDEVIEAEGTLNGVVKSKVTAKKWTHWGELKAVNYGASQTTEKQEVVISLEQARVKGGSLRMRMSPSSSGTVILSIPDGAVVQVNSKTNDFWWHVSYKGKSGYVMKSFLESYDPGEAKTGNTSIVLPTDTAEELYNALKKALGK